MNERLPIKRSELERPGEVFDAIAALRVGAQAQRAAYHESVGQMNALCDQLKGVEVIITGRLHGWRNRQVSANDPNSCADRLLVRISNATVETYEGHYGRMKEGLPFISIYGYTVESNETVSAYLGIGDLGVTAELVEPKPVQV